MPVRDSAIEIRFLYHEGGLETRLLYLARNKNKIMRTVPVLAQCANRTNFRTRFYVVVVHLLVKTTQSFSVGQQGEGSCE